MITVSFCCNDPDNGNFDGHVDGIEIHGIEIHRHGVEAQLLRASVRKFESSASIKRWIV